MLMCTCLMLSASFGIALCSSQKLEWSRTNGGSAIKLRQRQRAKWPALNGECTGSERKPTYFLRDMPISSSYMPGGSLFRPFQNSQKRFKWCGPGGKLLVSRKSSNAWENAGRKPKKKRQSGKGVLMLPLVGTC